MGADQLLVKPMHTRILLQQIEDLIASHERKLAQLGLALAATNSAQPPAAKKAQSKSAKKPAAKGAKTAIAKKPAATKKAATKNPTPNPKTRSVGKAKPLAKKAKASLKRKA
jgi:hypothetical protein